MRIGSLYSKMQAEFVRSYFSEEDGSQVATSRTRQITLETY
ncbi:hypothetical protein BH09BAC4_BH09BAC4_42800 [soil metagenome]